MGWFDEQIRQRKLSDQEIFEDSLFRMASAVLGRQRAGRLDDDRIVTKAAIDEILKYYHCKSAEIPDDIRDLDEQMEFCLRPHGLMRRSVRLEKGWYRDAFGPMLAFRREDGAAVALLPKPSAGYWFRDPESGGRIDLNRKTAELFEEDAICFYRPLPLKKLGIPDLIVYMKGCLNTGDFLCLAALMLTTTLIGLLLIVRLSIPINLLRAVMLAVSVAGLAIAFVFFPGFFNLAPLGTSALITMLVCIAVGIVLFNVLYNLADKLIERYKKQEQQE